MLPILSKQRPRPHPDLPPCVPPHPTCCPHPILIFGRLCLGGRGFLGCLVIPILTLPCCLPPWPKQEERIRRGDDLRLQMAIEESKRETGGQEEVSVWGAPSAPLRCVHVTGVHAGLVLWPLL